MLITIAHFYFTVCNVVRCTRLFCGREELETIVTLHSLVSEGQGRSGKVMRVTGMKWMSGL